MTTVNVAEGVEQYGVGYTIKFAHLPNSHVTKVTKIIDAWNMEIKTFIRPSRGFAKHIRRTKCTNHK